MDSEFPGVIVPNNPAFRKAEDSYAVLKANVNCLHLIQVGLTLSDSEGNLPNLGTSNHFIWEFNFCDFDVTRDLYAPDSIAFLRRQGIDFEMNRRFGIDTVRFAQLMKYSGLVCNNNIQWITFQGAYDFGYLVKALVGGALPKDRDYFLRLVKAFFGVRVYDVKHLVRFSPNLYGGLDRICQSLNLERAVGKNHQAASDSLLTLLAFKKIKDIYFDKENDSSMINYAGVLYGLELL